MASLEPGTRTASIHFSKYNSLFVPLSTRAQTRATVPFVPGPHTNRVLVQYVYASLVRASRAAYCLDTVSILQQNSWKQCLPSTNLHGVTEQNSSRSLQRKSTTQNLSHVQDGWCSCSDRRMQVHCLILSFFCALIQIHLVTILTTCVNFSFPACVLHSYI